VALRRTAGEHTCRDRALIRETPGLTLGKHFGTLDCSDTALWRPETFHSVSHPRLPNLPGTPRRRRSPERPFQSVPSGFPSAAWETFWNAKPSVLAASSPPARSRKVPKPPEGNRLERFARSDGCSRAVERSKMFPERVSSGFPDQGPSPLGAVLQTVAR